jgi:hypothetical protein
MVSVRGVRVYLPVLPPWGGTGVRGVVIRVRRVA